LRQALEKARAENIGISPPLIPASHNGLASAQHLQIMPIARPYALATCELISGPGTQEISDQTLIAIIKSVIAQEGPIHRDEIARRIASLLGKRRAGPRIAQAIEQSLSNIQYYTKDICHDAGFWFTPEQACAPIVRDRSAAPSSLRNINMIFVPEIRSAIAMARQQLGSLDRSQLPTAVAKLLGFPAALRTLVLSLAT
jgi:hypothetical protein